MPLKFAAVLGAVLAVSVSSGALAATQKFVAMAGGEKVGHLTAEVTGRHVAVDYAVVNNGRGPKAREQIDLDAAGMPVKWTIEGESLFGSPVNEHFTWGAGKAEWASQADKGEVSAAKPVLYIGNDVSPWMLGVYVKALLKAPGQTLPVLPSGQLKLKEVRKLTVGEGKAAIPVTVYELSGIDLNPDYVLLDARGDLFQAGGVIREGYESQLPMLQRVSREIAQSRAEDARRQLAHSFKGPVRIRNVRVFDPVTMKLSGPSQVIVFGDRIAGVQPEDGQPTPKDETTIDGQGGTLLPGLHDMHSHTSLGSNLFNLAAGVTATRDQGNDNTQLLGIIEGLNAGRLAGPRIVRNGFLEGRSPYSARNGFIADSLEDALRDVRWYADHGYWQVKIYNSFNPDWVAPVAAEARRLGMGVTGHVPAFSSPDRVIRDGYNDIAHINQLMLGWILDPKEDTRTPLRLTGMARGKDLDLTSERVQATVRLMKERGTALDTTAMILERLMLSRSGQVQAGDAPYLDHAPIAYQRYRKRSFVTIKTPQDDADYQKGFAKVLEVLKMLDDNGVQLLPGTDDGTGFSNLREMEVYVAAGIPPGRALYLSTLGAERYFKRDHELGTIERGKLADFILVDGDPTANISALRNTRMTMVGGVAYYPAEIYSFLAVKPFSPPPPVTAAVPASPAADR
ncbi:amidohydrolase family protein [Phenylobacterium sp.]|uniref:amidohydrolase family protein n=1 Tax=Phenylobacterium sp. TaxID=1871053 RepID=UPI0025DE09BE|nr:amidohydrolase family protein [Phenylobacterium sp.]MBX3484876.1 amidohydrolase family protein [Phenylobacterium sp.]MCW5758700.1 amidohydrolase family protein [Phenylobacterium sp.]